MKTALPPPSLRDRLLLAGLGLLPRSVASHLLFLLQSHPQLADGWGYHVRPIHYYQPLPDFRTITEQAAARRRVSPAIDFDLDGQRRLVARLAGHYQSELAELAATGAFDFGNDYFAGFDASLYYALIRDLRPRHVIEIGAGMSTRIADQALRRNRTAGHHGDMICIEPFPQPRLTLDMPAVTLIDQPVEAVPLEQFDVLQANDILFIDSSHAVKFGGDVCREFLEILPRLQRGVWIHVHDIFFPRDYPARWLIDQREAFTEQYLLEAFLAFNREFHVKAANFWLAGEFADEVKALVPESAWRSDDRGRGSFWMQRA